MKNKILILIIAMLILTTACKNKDLSEKETDKLQIYTSVYPMYDFAKRIAKDRADVINIIPAGQEAHGWEPSSKELNALETADVFIYNGAGLEHWVEKVLDNLNENVIFLEASKGLELLEGHHDHDEHEHDEHDHGEYDPHTWLSIKNAIKEMENIKELLIKVDPENEEYFEENFQIEKAKFEELNRVFESELKDLKNRKIVVNHEAFGYLARDYNLEQIGIQGLNAETEPDPKRMAEIVEFIKDKKIDTVFTETLISSKVSETIANETGAKVLVLNPIEGLTEEELNDNKDYISIMKDNLESLLKALK
ncbi:MAG: zinc ABC transporter substrate-binding protein [Tissierellia bacterium]|nr:zinc ABC transporter substrate-binding protein [Tissierellia bacterium]